MIELREVTKTYVRPNGEALTVLAGVDLYMDRGDFVSIIGPSGGGKTTLLNIVGCLLRPTSGRVILDGSLVNDLPAVELARLRNRMIGFIFQGTHLLPALTVWENIMLPAWLGGRKDRRERARELAERFGLADRLDYLPHELSLGQRRRVAVARALVNEPAILLADEPTNDLDPPRADQVVDILQTLNQDGLTVLVVTHRWELACRAHRCYEIRDGRLQPAVESRVGKGGAGRATP